MTSHVAMSLRELCRPCHSSLSVGKSCYSVGPGPIPFNTCLMTIDRHYLHSTSSDSEAEVFGPQENITANYRSDATETAAAAGKR